MGNWKFDPLHTQVEFSAKHLGMMTVRGHFADVTATGEIHPDSPDRTKIEATIKTESIRTHNEQRDKDLRASNFLEVDKFPTMTFKSTKIEPAGGNRYKLIGDLTIKGNTHPITIDVTNLGEFNDPRMGHRIGYSAETEINRKDYGMNFEMMLDGKFIVSNEIKINIEGELVEAAE
jgi:polyisoprenoid-binding protein YceI